MPDCVIFALRWPSPEAARRRLRRIGSVEMAQAITRFDGRRTLAGDDVASDQIDQVGQHRSPGGRPQCRVETNVKPLDHRVYGFASRFEAIEDAGFALPAMGDERADMALR